MAKSFHELSYRTQVVVFAALCGLTSAASWQLLLAPARAELATKTAQLATADAEVAKANAVARQLPVFEKDIARLQDALVRTTAVLPDEKDAQDVLRQLHEMASDSSLDISSFTPKPVNTKSNYSEWPIELGLDGGYHDLGRFFDRVANLPLLISISELHLKTKSSPTGKGSVTASCVATTFVFRRDGGPSTPPSASSAPKPGTAGGKS